MFRTYKLSHDINLNKQTKIFEIIKEYRLTARSISNILWDTFYKSSKLPKYVDTKYIPSKLSERYKQVCLAQVRGMVSSYIENRKNDFKDYVYRSSISDEDLRLKLFYVNKYALWFSKESVKMKDLEIDENTLRLARDIARRSFKINRKSSVSNIGLALDAKVIQIEKSTQGHFDYWVKLSTLEKGKPIYLPLTSNEHFESKEGKLAKFVQITAKNNRLSVSLLKELERKETYTSMTDRIGIDLGLSCLIATSKGDMFGREYFFKYLKKMDDRILILVKRLNKQGIKLRYSKRYRNLIANLKAFIKNNVNRAINRIIELYSPKELVLERLNFQNSALSKRLNRILGNFGKGIVRKKLDELSERLGITVTEVNPAYTSQTCSSCGYVSDKSRKNQATFICAFCNKKLNADVNASRNIEARSSSLLKSIYKSKAFILQTTINSFLNKHVSFNSRARAIDNSKYFRLSLSPNSV